MAGKNKEELAKQKERDRLAQAKLEADKRKKEEAELFKPAQTQKVPFGVGACARVACPLSFTVRLSDPKTVLCAFFKAGHCDKGNKCALSCAPSRRSFALADVNSRTI